MQHLRQKAAKGLFFAFCRTFNPPVRSCATCMYVTWRKHTYYYTRKAAHINMHMEHGHNPKGRQPHTKRPPFARRKTFLLFRRKSACYVFVVWLSTIPNSVMSISNWGFCSCSSLPPMTMCGGVKDIGFAAFAGYSDLSDVTCLVKPLPICCLPHRSCAR